MRNMSLLVLLIAALSLIFPSHGLAAIECVVAAGSEAIPVFDQKTGESIGVVRAGDWIQFNLGNFYLIYNEAFRPIKDGRNTVNPKLRCASPRSAEYPIVIDINNLQDRVQLYQEFGMVGDGRGVRAELPKLPHKCAPAGLSNLDMEFSEPTFALYKQQGYDLRRLCAVMNGGSILFDPEDGQRIPTYVYAQTWTNADGSKGAEISDELPFVAPPCFARGGLVIRKQLPEVQMAPLGCTLKYHPWSGRRLNEGETTILSKELALHYSTLRGTESVDSNDLSSDPTRRLSSMRIEAIKKIGAQK